MVKRIQLASFTALAAWAVGAGLAMAQTPQDEAGQETATLDEVVVTAQRRSENLQRAALAVDVATAEDLQQAGVVSVSTLNAAVPSLTVQQGSGANTIYFVRGVGNFTSNGYSDSAVAFNLDGVYVARTTSTTSAFFDLERIEVLKGPQGTLYGRNATGGAINVIPNRPRIGENGGRLSVGAGSYGLFDAEAAANLTVSDQLAVRLSAITTQRDGYNDDGTSDEEGWGVRAQLLFQPTEELSIRLSADRSHQGGIGPSPSYVGFQRYTPGTPATATSVANYTFQPSGLDERSGLHSPQARALFAAQTIGGAFINPAPLEYPYLDNDYSGLLAELVWETALGTLTVIPAYRESTLDNLFNGPSFRAGFTNQDDNQTSIEARFQGERIGPFDWLVGAYWFDEDVSGQYSFQQYAVTSFQAIASQAESTALFGRVTANLSDRLRLVVGGRHTEDDKSFQASVQTLVLSCTRVAPPAGPGCFGGPSVPAVRTFQELTVRPTAPGPANGVAFGTFGNRLFYNQTTINQTQSESRDTYRVAVEYDAGPASLLYASFETGYRSGGFSTAFGRETFKPEFLDAFTVGSKNRYLANRLQLNVEAFHWKYKDQQVSHFGLDGNNANNFFTENIGRSTIRGVDLETQFLATESTLLNATIQYLDSKVDSFVYDAPRLPTSLPPATGCAVTPAISGTTNVFRVDCSGKTGFNAPKWSINAGIEQTVGLGAFDLVLNATVRYRSNAVVAFDYFPQQETGDNTTLDISGRFGPRDGDWGLTAYVRNITDETVLVYQTYNATVAGNMPSFYAPPRTYGVRLDYAF